MLSRFSPLNSFPSLPTHRPRDVARNSRPPTPLVLPGFQSSAAPVVLFSAAIPSRLLAPGPAKSLPNGLSTQRW